MATLLTLNVEIPVRHFETYLDKVEAGEKTCVDYTMEMTTQATVRPNSPTKVAMDATSDRETKDPQRVKKRRLADRTNELCPAVASGVLR